MPHAPDDQPIPGGFFTPAGIPDPYGVPLTRRDLFNLLRIIQGNQTVPGHVVRLAKEAEQYFVRAWRP